MGSNVLKLSCYAGNPIAKLISKLKLEANIAVLKFPKSEVDELIGNDSDDTDDEVSGTGNNDHIF